MISRLIPLGDEPRQYFGSFHDFLILVYGCDSDKAQELQSHLSAITEEMVVAAGTAAVEEDHSNNQENQDWEGI